jgi:cobalt-zinc-cadmium efflux system membrane fusion protein
MLRAAHKRQSRLLKEQIASRRAVEEARAAYRRADVASRLARQRLRNLGLTEAEVAKVRDATSALVLRAPFGGTVVERSATRGQVADTRTELFAIADLGRLWVDLSVPEKEAARIPVGTPIEVRVQALPGEVIKGRVSWLSPAIDERTRMVRARGVVPNERGLLRHGMFAEVSAVLGNQPDAFRIPSAAIQRVDNLPFVFIQQEPSLFAARRVTVSPTRTTGEQLIRGGLRGGEPVVVDGSHALKSALLASRLGAGCTDD